MKHAIVAFHPNVKKVMFGKLLMIPSGGKVIANVFLNNKHLSITNSGR